MQGSIRKHFRRPVASLRQLADIFKRATKNVSNIESSYMHETRLIHLYKSMDTDEVTFRIEK